ncbi:MAG TPA: cytochrome c-type biogenesis protein CcmH [Thermoleophilaceae bacterium]|nr:cytochrome c-type biogenesis protein CcmH [Thermoleophilaceae bacterium]
MRRVPALLAALMLGLAAPATALAQDCPKTTLGAVEDEVMCPVCGTPLGLATEAPQAIREREFIQRLVDSCATKDQVKARLAAEFGDEVLALPKPEGFDLAAYLIPGLAVLLGGGAVGAAALRWRRVRRGGEDPDTDGAPAGSERLQRDLDRYEL